MIISPSMRLQVTQNIFESAISKNEIFQDQTDIVEFIIFYLNPKLYLPEDYVIEYGGNGKDMFFIASGSV